MVYFIFTVHSRKSLELKLTLCHEIYIADIEVTNKDVANAIGNVFVGSLCVNDLQSYFLKQVLFNIFKIYYRLNILGVFYASYFISGKNM